MTPNDPVEAVDHAITAIARYDRPDLDARPRHTRTRPSSSRVRVLVVGEF